MANDNQKSLPRTIQQDRAASAWEQIQSIKNSDFKKKYKGLVRSAPADIQTSGLGQTVAFWRAKNKEEHISLYRHVSDWMKRKDEGITRENELHLWIIDTETSGSAYRRATAEALAYLGWLKRFAEAEIEGEAEESK